MKHYIITEQLRNGLIAYLETRPWAEVNAGMVALLQLREFHDASEQKMDE